MVKHFTNYSTPLSLSVFFNWGIILSFLLSVQIFTGVLLSMHYTSSDPFNSLMILIYEMKFGFLIHHTHQISSSLFMGFLFLHMFKSFFFKSPSNKMFVWIIGFIMFLFSFAISFLSYVLPFSQMSFWSATVITNLISVIPYFDLVNWVWSSFLVGLPTLNRFFVLHFLLPFLLVVLVFTHLILLHNSGSSRLSYFTYKVSFSPYFILKDLYWLVSFLFFIIYLSVMYLNIFLDVDNFYFANPLSTPPHIKPEWYFLFVYAILRSIPNKSLSVIALVSSLMIPLLAIFLNNFNYSHMVFFIMNWALLSFLSSEKIEYPFSFLSQIIGVLYFIILYL